MAATEGRTGRPSPVRKGHIIAETTTTAAISERWEATAPVSADYARDCCELAHEALSHVGLGRFEETPYAGLIACSEGDLPVTVAVLPVPPEGFEMTLEDLQSLIDDEVVMHGASPCIGRALLSDGPLPERLRFDVVGVCANYDAGRVRIHHVRGRGSREAARACHASGALPTRGAFPFVWDLCRSDAMRADDRSRATAEAKPLRRPSRIRRHS